MKRDPTATLVDLSKNREENEQKRFAHLLRQSSSEEEKLAMLERYRREYADRLAEQSRQGIAMQSMANYNQFMAHLEGALAQQQGQASRSRDALANGLASLREAQLRSKVFEALVERRQNAMRVKTERRRQAQEDEMAARAFCVGAQGKSST